MIPNIIRIKRRNTTTLASAGKDFINDETSTRIFSIFFTLLKGRSTRIARNAVRFATPGSSPTQPTTTTKKSRTFHGSRIYVRSSAINPIATIFMKHSSVNKIQNQSSELSTRSFRHDVLPEGVLNSKSLKARNTELRIIKNSTNRSNQTHSFIHIIKYRNRFSTPINNNEFSAQILQPSMTFPSLPFLTYTLYGNSAFSYQLSTSGSVTFFTFSILENITVFVKA